MLTSSEANPFKIHLVRFMWLMLPVTVLVRPRHLLSLQEMCLVYFIMCIELYIDPKGPEALNPRRSRYLSADIFMTVDRIKRTQGFLKMVPLKCCYKVVLQGPGIQGLIGVLERVPIKGHGSGFV